MLTGASPHLHSETQAKDEALHPEHCHLSCEREAALEHFASVFYMPICNGCYFYLQLIGQS